MGKSATALQVLDNLHYDPLDQRRFHAISVPVDPTEDTGTKIADAVPSKQSLKALIQKKQKSCKKLLLK